MTYTASEPKPEFAPGSQASVKHGRRPLDVILSFDVEEHYRIEAAHGMSIGSAMMNDCRTRVEPMVHWLLDLLDQHKTTATFFVLGQIAQDNPRLIRTIRAGGHEIGSHGWDHRRVLELTPAEFQQDIRQSKDALEQAAGAAVLGYRAPTFSILRRTAWALDLLGEEGYLYDSSIYPVHHDRYGVATAPRMPFLAHGPGGQPILEIPPATLRLPAMNLPVGGGGYFRLFPPMLLRTALRQTGHQLRPPVAMLYFHPWEFDPGQPRLPLRGVNRFRTYVGISRTQGRLARLLRQYRFRCAEEVARALLAQPEQLVMFPVGADRA